MVWMIPGGCDISIHAPVKGATLRQQPAYPKIFYFNPRSREGSDRPNDIIRGSAPMISIHAPVKGATAYRHRLCTSMSISIHAPVKGATDHVAFWGLHGRISIHAPVKGATLALR